MNGSVDPASQTEQILATTAITGSTATADEGYKFDGWYKGETKISEDLMLGATDAVANLNKTQAGNYADTAYVAKFVVDPDQTYTVTYTAESNGSVDPTTQTEQILSTTAITGSAATADPGYKFEGWYKGETKISENATLSAADAVANLNKTQAGNNADTTYVAKFVEDPDQTYTITYESAGHGSVDPEEETLQVLHADGIEGSTLSPSKSG